MHRYLYMHIASYVSFSRWSPERPVESIGGVDQSWQLQSTASGRSTGVGFCLYRRYYADYADVLATSRASLHIGAMGKCKRGHGEFPRPTEQIRDAVVYGKIQFDCAEAAATALPGDGSCQVTRPMKQHNEDQHALMAEHYPPVADLSIYHHIPMGLDTTLLTLDNFLAVRYLDFPTPEGTAMIFDAMKQNQHVPRRYRAYPL